MISEDEKKVEKETAGTRLYARAAEINAKLAIKRQQAKIKEEEQVVNLFRPRLVTKSTRPESAGGKGKAFERLYENSKQKQQRDVARKHAQEVQRIQKTTKQSFITPDKATALYERTFARKQERDKKVLQLEASLVPTFSPQLVTEETTPRAKSRAKSRPKSRGRDRESADRLYTPNYLKERDEKYKKIKEKELEEITFSPTLNKPPSKLEKQGVKQNDGPVWNRLYERTKQPKKIKDTEENHSFKPDISKSQRLLSPQTSLRSDGTKVYDRLYKNHESKHSKVTKHIPASDEHELTFQPVINKSKFPNDLTREERINNLYQQGMRSVVERRSMSLANEPKKEVKKEEEELTFQPKTNWGRSKILGYNAAATEPKGHVESSAEPEKNFEEEMGNLDAALNDLQMSLAENETENETENDENVDQVNNELEPTTDKIDEDEPVKVLPIDPSIVIDDSNEVPAKEETPLPQSIENTEMY